MEQSFRRRVVFSETDASGRVHFSHFFKWVEDAEHQLLRSLGVPVFSEASGWPRVSVQCDYLQPVLYDDEVEVELRLSKIGKSALHWTFRILKARNAEVARGTMVTVYVIEGESTKLPEAMLSALTELL